MNKSSGLRFLLVVLILIDTAHDASVTVNLQTASSEISCVIPAASPSLYSTLDARECIRTKLLLLPLP